MTAIPDKFYTEDNYPRVRTVGQLKKLLAELPDALRLGDAWGGPLDLVVFNHGDGLGDYLQFCEVERDL